ncbi:MAG: PorP/SprF family type IX secretion system membrane protein [Bacteroidales bacterium]|nr:PorP/SprF family type IX secretion system membrane protein [Bacteroidales bacterium]
MQIPLAETLRPKKLDSYIGQVHLMADGAPLRQAIETGNLHSMILWGPPGVGKTTLALLIAELTDSHFHMLSAINSGVKDIRDIIEKAKKDEGRSILFIDEIHRFSKSQQDSLLGAVEQGIVTLIGATTENPSFEVISPLLSRCQVYVLKNLERNELEQILEHACHYLENERGIRIQVEEDEALLRTSGGDARKLLNAIELVVNAIPPQDGVVAINNENVQRVIQKNLAVYDKNGENHYDIISAFIKSLRGSDPNAAVYWMARMLAAGEDPLFIARRMIILASEDIGNANPNALLLANTCFQAVHQIGMPEARIILSQTAVYLASSPKSNASYLAIDEALDWVKKTGDLPVPLHLRNAPTRLMKDLGYHDGYLYAHDYEQNFVNQEFLPEQIRGKKFYEPQNNARENELRRYLRNCWKDKYRYILLIAVFIASLLPSFGQDIHYSQFDANPIYLNPANTGAFDGIFRVGVNQKTQWLAVSKPYLTFSGSFDAPVYKSNAYRQLLGVGVQFNTDRTGDSRYSTFTGALSVAFTKALDKRNRFKIGLGAYAGLVHQSLDYAALTFDEQYQHGFFDASAPISEVFGREKFTTFDCGAGISFNITPSKQSNFGLGMSVSHLHQPNISLYDSNTRLHRKYTGYFVSRFVLVEGLAMSPAVYTAFQHRYREITFGTLLEYEYYKTARSNRFAAGGGIFYRWADALIICGTVQWENLRLGLSYDLNLSTLRAASHVRGGFEVSLYYIFKKQKSYRPGFEPCPYDIM